MKKQGEWKGGIWKNDIPKPQTLREHTVNQDKIMKIGNLAIEMSQLRFQLRSKAQEHGKLIREITGIDDSID